MSASKYKSANQDHSLLKSLFSLDFSGSSSLWPSAWGGLCCAGIGLAWPYALCMENSGRLPIRLKNNFF